MEEEKEEDADGKRLQNKEDAGGHHQSLTPGSSSWELPFVPFFESPDLGTGEGGGQATGEKGGEEEGVKGMGRRWNRKGLLLQNVTNKPRNPHLTQPEPLASSQPCREPSTDPKQNLGKQRTRQTLRNTRELKPTKKYRRRAQLPLHPAKQK